MGPDFEQLSELGEAAAAAVEAMGAQARQLGAKPVTGSSRDGLIKVRVNGTGRQLMAIRLEDGAMLRYDSTALSEVVTRTIRDTQRQARTAFEVAVAALTPPEVTAAQSAAADTYFHR
jgi:DNA-binding protein YbaB